MSGAESARELAGKVAVVTGGSRGIGRSIAEHLAAAGARVAVIARDVDRARETAGALPGDGHVGLGCDVADPKAVDVVVRQVESDLGSLDILVNNAGVTGDNLLMRLTDAEWDRVVDTNLKGTFNMIRSATRGMLRRRDGRIINITSVVGITGNAGQANYAASKAGVIGLTKSVAKELASRNILCNALAPGYIETEMTAGLGETVREALLGQIALGRLGRGDDIASVVRFLAGPGAAYITGQVIVVDGGMVI